MRIEDLPMADRAALERFRANQYGDDKFDAMRRLHDAASALQGMLDAQQAHDAELAGSITPERLVAAGFVATRAHREGITTEWTLRAGDVDVVALRPSTADMPWGFVLHQVDGELHLTRSRWGAVVRLVEALKGGDAC